MTFADFLSLVGEPFVVRALLAGLGVAVMAGMLGCFVVWRGLAYFGDSLAHSTMLGVALGLLAGIGVAVGMVAVGLGFAVLLLMLRTSRVVTSDALLGILGHTALAAALVVLALAGRRVDLHAYLFGDILAVGWQQIWWMYGVAAAVVALLVVGWQRAVLLVLDEDMARLRGVPVVLFELIFLLVMALAVALSVRVVGILLIAAMLIIPAATARVLARTPEAMAVLSVAFAVLAVVVGLGLSLVSDTPTGPMIVLTAAGMFLLVRGVRW